MRRQRFLFGSLFVVVISFVGATRENRADDRVLARSNWGALPMYPGSATNGYGGYYVRENARGNNYESRRPFTNPHGLIVPAQAATCPPQKQIPTNVVPMQPQQTPVTAVAQAQQSPVTAVPVQPAQSQPSAAPYRMTRIPTTWSR